MDSLKLKEVFNTPNVLNQLWARSDRSPTWRQEVSEAADAETSEEVKSEPSKSDGLPWFQSGWVWSKTASKM